MSVSRSSTKEPARVRNVRPELMIGLALDALEVHGTGLAARDVGAVANDSSSSSLDDVLLYRLLSVHFLLTG